MLHKESVLLTYRALFDRKPDEVSELAPLITPTANMISELWIKSESPHEIQSSDISKLMVAFCNQPGSKTDTSQSTSWINQELIYIDALSGMAGIILEISAYKTARKQLFIGDLSMSDFTKLISKNLKLHLDNLTQYLMKKHSITEIYEQEIIVKNISDLLIKVLHDAFEIEFLKLKKELAKMNVDQRKKYHNSLLKYPEGTLLHRSLKSIDDFIMLLLPGYKNSPSL